MRRNLRYDGVPFRPVTTRLAEDKPRLVVVADVSLSVRTTARFTLHVVHALQDLFAQVRTFAFVEDVVEITDDNSLRLDVFADLTRRVRETIWLTPEPRYSWALGGCDLPAYAESCDRVEVIRDHSGLESWATDVVTRASAR
jgi:uncharacterized protein with von Willebrand factor type A (vWA) domain